MTSSAGRPAPELVPGREAFAGPSLIFRLISLQLVAAVQLGARYIFGIFLFLIFTTHCTAFFTGVAEFTEESVCHLSQCTSPRQSPVLQPFPPDWKMPAKEPQLRVDPADGNAYPLDSFLEFYGKGEGQRRWASAGQQPACPGISMMHVHM